MNYQSIKDGITVNIHIGESNHWFSTVKNGVTYEFQIKSFTSDYKDKSVTVAYVEILRDSEGVPLKSTATSYTESTPQRYQGLYSLNSFSEAAGDFYGKQCVNGVMERILNWKAFDNAGELIDYSAE